MNSLVSISSNNFDSQSIVQQRSHENKQFNEKQAISKIPEKIFHCIFENINSDQDLESVIYSSHNLSIRLRALLAKKKIQKILDCIKLIDEKIANLTKGKFHLISSDSPNDLEVACQDYHFFQFNWKKWDSFQKTDCLSTSCWHDHIAECFLDAVEAVAEYNIASELILSDVNLDTFRHENFSQHASYNAVNHPKNRFINKIDITKNESAHNETMLRKILGQAKETLKGCAFIADGSDDGIAVDPLYLGPLIRLGLYNPEHNDWNRGDYKRVASNPQSSGVKCPAKDLIGMREGDRICSMLRGMRIISRCVNRINDIGRSFENELVRAVFGDTRSYDSTFPSFKESKEIEKEVVRLRHVIKKVYSKKLVVDAIQQRFIRMNFKISVTKKYYKSKRLFRK